MESAGDLVIHAAARHLFERGCDDRSDLLFTCASVPIDEQVERGGMRKFRSAAEAAIGAVERAEAD